MRAAVVWVILGTLVSSAHADPFEVRNPVPDAPPSASVTFEHERTFETLDPGLSRRRLGTLVAGSAIVFWGASFAISYAMVQRFKVDVELIDEGIDINERTKDANRALDISRTWGTSLFAAGVVAAGAGAYLYFTAPKKLRREQMIVAPTMNDSGAGVAISGGF